jgi:hypothetical protein
VDRLNVYWAAMEARRRAVVSKNSLRGDSGLQAGEERV